LASNKVNIEKNEQTSLVEVMFSDYVLDRYNVGLTEINLKFKELPNILKDIKKFNLKEYKFNLGLYYTFIVLENENMMVAMDIHENRESILASLFFNNYEIGQELFNALKKYEDLDSELFVSIEDYYLSNNGAIKSSMSTKTKKDFQGTKSFYYPYLKTDELFKQYELSDSNILVLCGKPGIGKTRLTNFYMKYLLDNLEKGSFKKQPSEENKIDAILNGLGDDEDISIYNDEGIDVCYVKNEDVLSMDEFWVTLKTSFFDLVILDDLDYALLPRTQEVSSGEDVKKNKFLSQFLSFTDGIFEEGNRTKFIITTNREVKDIDSAVLRKGRTFDILELRDLKKHEAREIWKKEGLDDDLFLEKFSDENGNILQSDLGSEVEITKKSIEKNISLEPYIKEEGISLYNKIKNPKKIGL